MELEHLDLELDSIYPLQGSRAGERRLRFGEMGRFDESNSGSMIDPPLSAIKADYFRSTIQA